MSKTLQANIHANKFVSEIEKDKSELINRKNKLKPAK